MTAGARDPVPGEVYLEFRQVGRSMRVAAVDARTGIEVTIVGPVSTPQSHLERLALRKLTLRLAAEGREA